MSTATLETTSETAEPHVRTEHAPIPFRTVVAAGHLAQRLWMEDGAAPIYSRAAREAGIS